MSEITEAEIEAAAIIDTTVCSLCDRSPVKCTYSDRLGWVCAKCAERVRRQGTQEP